MLVHHIIKINYVREGYLPNHPYHMISDREMFQAFLNDSDECYFDVHYPCLHETLREHYDNLKAAISYHIEQYLSSSGDIAVPDWVYTYMLGEVISIHSSVQDRHDLLVLMNIDNINDELTKESFESCLAISEEWVKKLPPSKSDHRPPTIFGEPHVIKALRLLSVDILS